MNGKPFGLAAMALSAWLGLSAPLAAQTWTQTSAPISTWSRIVCSADGTKVFALDGAGALYTSADSGATWSKGTRTGLPTTNWVDIASSADGSHLVLVAAGNTHGGLIYTSANSGGIWLQQQGPAVGWVAAASSADGSKLVLLSDAGSIYTSVNAGAAWTSNNAPALDWTAVASSADGSKLVATAAGRPPVLPPPMLGGIYLANGAGAPWTVVNGSNLAWGLIAASADGNRLLAAIRPGTSGVALSANTGATWTWQSVPTTSWSAVAASADGSTLVAVEPYSSFGIPYKGRIYTSTNAGTTWTQGAAPQANWSCVAASADGSKLVAGSYYSLAGGSGGIYTWQALPSLSLSCSANQTVVAWPALSSAANFVLQETASLDTPNWTDVTDQPQLVNGQKQVTRLRSGTAKFYRLRANR